MEDALRKLIIEEYKKKFPPKSFVAGESSVPVSGKVFDENEIFYKIGITGKSIQERYKYTGNIPYNYEIIEEIKSKNLEYIWNLEKENKKILKDFKYKPLKSFAGSSVECFSKLNKKILKLN